MDGRNVLRSAKAATDWTPNELLAYNIEVSQQDPNIFFGKELSPFDDVDPKLLISVDPTSVVATTEPGLSKDAYHFHTYLRLASRPDINQKGALHDFGRTLYRILGFEEAETILRSHYDIYFIICSDYKIAEADLCLIHVPTSMVLLVSQQRPECDSEIAEPQMIASAVAAFQHNNERRIARGLEPLDSMVIPCVALVGRRPTFYKVPVSIYLSECVITGEYPTKTTLVLRCTPPSPPRSSDGMEMPSYRRTALQYLNEFRDIAKECWTPFLQN